MKSVFTQLASNTRLLEATERYVRVQLVSTVDPSSTGLQSVCCPQSLVDILAENCGGQSVRYYEESFRSATSHRKKGGLLTGIVRLANHVFLILELDDDTDRTENLLSDDLHLGSDIGEDGGFNEVTLGTDALSTVVHCCTLGLPRVDVAHDALKSRSEKAH